MKSIRDRLTHAVAVYYDLAFVLFHADLEQDEQTEVREIRTRPRRCNRFTFLLPLSNPLDGKVGCPETMPEVRRRAHSMLISKAGILRPRDWGRKVQA